MTEWGVVGVLVVIVGLVISLVTPIIKLNTIITKLGSSVESMKESLDELTTRNSTSHDRIFKRLDDTEDKVCNHEARITVLEKKT